MAIKLNTTDPFNQCTNLVAQRMENLINTSKCSIEDVHSCDKNEIKSAIKSINAQVGWSHYNDSIIGRLFQNNHTTLLALKGEAIAGYIQFYPQGNKECYVSYIAVDQTVQNSGVGKNLMFAALAKIAEQGYSCATLSYRGNKPNLVKFYNQIAINGELTKLESPAGIYSNGDPRRSVVYDLSENSL